MATAGIALPRIAGWARKRGLEFRHDDRTGFGAVFSRCTTWRYLLWRAASPHAKFVGVGMLNPSRADETQDDPTIRQCRARMRQAGFSGLIVWNLFAFRATLPADLKRAADPIGPDNDAAIALALELSSRTILAWGNHGVHHGRDRAVLMQCARADIAVLGHTAQGQPRHPLYLPRATRLRRWNIAGDHLRDLPSVR
jgi:hypothetical protein